jgi:hypothetical protein
MDSLGVMNTQVRVVRAKGIRGKKGDVILELEYGKIGLPRGFTPREREWYLVEIVDDRDRYAIVRLHEHKPTPYGVCRICGYVVNSSRLREFGEQWISNLLISQRINEIKRTKHFVLGRIDALISDLDRMIERLKKQQEPMLTRPVQICEYGIDSCFSYVCDSPECVKLGNIIWSLERIRSELVERRFAVARALEYDIIVTTTPLSPAERIFVPGI